MLSHYHSYHFTSGGIREYSDSMTIRGKQNINREIASTLSNKNYRSIILPPELRENEEWREVELLYQAVENALHSHIFSAQKFHKRITGFDYTLGPIRSLCQKHSVDAILILNGIDEQRTKRRKQLVTKAVVGSIAGSMVGALLGVGGGYAVPRGDLSLMSAGLIDSEGNIIWYHYTYEAGKKDFTRQDDVSKFLQNLFKKLPEGNIRS